MKIGLLIISTGNYTHFIDPLIKSVNEFFMIGFDVNIYLFTDSEESLRDTERVKVTQVPIKHVPWPYPTLWRYKYFHLNREQFDCDYLYYIDVDMLIVDSVGVEIIPDEDGLTVVQHPGFYKGGGSWENNKESTAYTPPELRNKYYAGGFNGGTKIEFLKMAKELDMNIDIDSRISIMAEWHDEAHLNRYMAFRNPKVLTPSHCFPEDSWAKKLQFKKRILALSKNHKKIRT